MLKGKRSTVSACSLSSCRIRAEALARAFNNRIWPCVWVPRRSSAQGDGIDDEEEFFDASPSPVEDESLFCQQHSSAATEAGRAKLYELLQQHAADDAIDVFYDVSEDAGLADDANDTCLEEESCQSSACCRLSDGECRCPREDDGELAFPPLSQSNADSLNSGVPDPFESGEREEVAADEEEECGEGSPSNEDKSSAWEEESPTLSNEDKREEDKSSGAGETAAKGDGDSVQVEESAVVPSDVIIDNATALADESENALNSAPEQHSDDVSIPENAETLPDDNDVEINVTADTDSPSSGSDTKVASPTSRLDVFDESRPKISRSTSLKTGKTPPGTPSRKKIVRFADVLGLDLEDVRHIMTGDVPIVPSSAYTDLDLRGVPRCEPISETIEISRNPFPAPTATNVLYPTFSIPGDQPDFVDRVRGQGICLRTVTVSETSVQCTCVVVNYGYHKKVIARYTANDWQTCNDIDAAYVSSSSDGETDAFAFSIFLSPHNKSVQFALKYDVNGREYWDNNRNQNYCLKFHGNYHTQHLQSPLWQHQFW